MTSNPLHYVTRYKWLFYVPLALFIPITADTQEGPSANSNGYSLLTAPPRPEVYLIYQCKKYHIQSPAWVVKNGFKWEDIRKVQTSYADAIPTGHEIPESAGLPGTPLALENQLVQALDGSMFLVQHAERHYMPEWMVRSRYPNTPIVELDASKLKSIPEGKTCTPAKDRIAIGALMVALLAFFAVSMSRGRRRLCMDSTSAAAKGPFSKTAYYLMGCTFLVILMVIVLREPNLITHPRFWAEEGSAWFQYAASHNVLQTLVFVYPPAGYSNLIANLAAILSFKVATGFGLEYAPLVTTLVALVVQLLPISLVLFGRSRLLDSYWTRVTVCLILLFAPTATDEVWLTSGHSLTYLALFTFLLLFERLWLWPRWLKWVCWVLLALAGLSGAYAVVLLPLFLWSAFLYRKREILIECGILAGCLALQAAVFVYSVLGPGIPNRSAARLDTSLVNVLVGQVLEPSLGASSTQKTITVLGLDEAWRSASSFAHPPSSSLLIGAWLSFFALMAVIWILSGPNIASLKVFCLGAFILISMLTSVAALFGVPSRGRYAVIPGFCFLLLLLVNIVEVPRWRILPYLCIAILSYGLANGIVAYWRPVWNNPGGGPSWSTEVQLWRADHKHLLKVWPAWWPEGIKLNEE